MLRLRRRHIVQVDKAAVKLGINSLERLAQREAYIEPPTNQKPSIFALGLILSKTELEIDAWRLPVGLPGWLTDHPMNQNLACTGGDAP